MGEVGDFRRDQGALAGGEVTAVQVGGEDKGKRIAIGGEILGARLDAGDLAGAVAIAAVEDAAFKENDPGLVGPCARMFSASWASSAASMRGRVRRRGGAPRQKDEG